MADSFTRTLFTDILGGTKYVYNRDRASRLYVAGTIISGTMLVEVTCAPLDRVEKVEAGGTDQNVLWEPWNAGTLASGSAFGTVNTPWTAARIVATNARVNVALG